MKSLLLATILICISHTTRAAILLDDQFNTNGPLPGQTPTVGGTWAGSGTQLQVSVGALQLPSVDGSASSSFTQQSQGSTFAGISFSVTQSPSSGGTFFFSFLDSSDSSVARLFIVSSGDSSTFQIGIENDLDNPIYWNIPLSLNTTYLAVVGFSNNGAADTSTLWIDPVSQSSTSVQDASESVATSIEGIIFRGARPFGGVTRAELSVSSIRVSDSFNAVIPEPTIFGLLLLTAGVYLMKRVRANNAIHRMATRRTPDADSLSLACIGRATGSHR